MIILTILENWFYSLLYGLQSGICEIIDFIILIFYKLCGLETVSIDGNEEDLVSNLLWSDIVRQAFWGIFLIGVILLVLFVIIAMIRSEYQAAERKNKVAIFAKAGRSFLTFLVIPFVLLAGVMLTNTIMGAIHNSMQPYILEQGQRSLIGGQILVTTGYSAYIGPEELRTGIEKQFITGELNYMDQNVVEMYYNKNGLNYLVGIVGGLCILVMFVFSSLTFIQRIFDIILLYIISPVSISTIPLDDGNRFRLWRDMLIAKVLSAYGIVLTMNLFFMIIPQVSQIQFFSNTFQNGVVHILFLIGGAFAVSKANLLIAQLCGNQAGGRELAQVLYNIRTGFAFTRGSAAVVGGLIGRAIGGGDYIRNRRQGATRTESLNQAFHSQRNQKVLCKNEAQHSMQSRVKRWAGMPVRFATLPFGVVKDLANGGVIQVGKNFGPRLRNAWKGSTILSRAEVRKKTSSEKNNEPTKNIPPKRPKKKNTPDDPGGAL